MFGPSVHHQEIEGDNRRESKDHGEYTERPKDILQQEGARLDSATILGGLIDHGTPHFLFCGTSNKHQTLNDGAST